MLTQVGLQAPDPLIQLYEWHNGIFHLNAFLHFLPLEEALSIYRMFMEITDRSGNFGWQPGLLPIMDINGDINLCFDLLTGQLVTIDLEDDKVTTLAPHYEPYVRALKDVFDRMAYIYDDNSGSIEIDSAYWSELARAYGFRKSWWAAKA